MAITQASIIASEMAMRNYKEDINPIIWSLTSHEAKKAYATTMLTGLCVDLAQLTGEDFESTLDETIELVKQEISQTPLNAF